MSRESRFCDVAVSRNLVYGVGTGDGVVYALPLNSFGTSWSSVIASRVSSNAGVKAFDINDQGHAFAIRDDGKIYGQKIDSNSTVSFVEDWPRAAANSAKYIAVDSTALYVVGLDGHIYSQPLESMTPTTRWTLTSRGNRDSPLQGIAVYNGRLYGIGGNFKIYVKTLAGTTAATAWQVAGRGKATAICACESGLFVIGQEPGYDLFKQTGTESHSWAWDKQLWFSDPPDPTFVWSRIQDLQRFVGSIPFCSHVQPQRCTRIVCVSDTHGKHRDLQPSSLNCDILVHAGDLSRWGGAEEFEDVAVFFNELLAKGICTHIIVVPGNHDNALQTDEETCNRLRQSCKLLLDESVHVCGLDCYGSPWQPEYSGHDEYTRAFTLPRGKPLRSKWEKIPNGTDVLITHGPPLGRGDELRGQRRAGCYDLLQSVQKLVPQPRLVISGHIHEGHGFSSDGETVFINAACLRSGTKGLNSPIVVDLPKDYCKPARVSIAVEVARPDGFALAYFDAQDA